MEALVNLDLRFYHKHAVLLSDCDVAEGAYLYTGWCFSPFPTEILQESIRTRLECLTKRKVVEYDDIAKSVRKWKNEVDVRIWRHWKQKETKRQMLEMDCSAPSSNYTERVF